MPSSSSQKLSKHRTVCYFTKKSAQPAEILRNMIPTIVQIEYCNSVQIFPDETAS
jgi:hypothetical protein